MRRNRDKSRAIKRKMPKASRQKCELERQKPAEERKKRGRTDIANQKKTN